MPTDVATTGQANAAVQEPQIVEGSTSLTTAPPVRRAGYAPAQMIVHWSIVFLVAMQFLMNKSMSVAYEASVEAGTLLVNGGVITHAMGGSLILGLMVYRLYLRLTHGAPPPPKDLPGWLQKVSRANHWAWYGLLIAQPLGGILALVLVAGWVGVLHTIGAWLIAASFALHFSGALFHAFKRDGVITRMASADPAHGGP